MGKITINELSDSLKNQIEGKQNKNDNKLETSDKTVVGAINELYKNKAARDALASVLQDEKVTVLEKDNIIDLIDKTDDHFDYLNNQLAGKINPVGTAVASDVLAGKTFSNSTGQTITGTMADHPQHTYFNGYKAWTNTALYIGIPNGAYINNSPAAQGPEIYMNYTDIDSNWIPENIVNGKSICGVTGTAGGYNMIPGTKYVMSQGYVDGRSNPTLDMCTVYIKRDGRLTVNINFHGENRHEYIYAYTKDANGNVINTQSYHAGFGADDTYWEGVQVYANTYLNIVIQTGSGWYGKEYHWWYAILFDLE